MSKAKKNPEREHRIEMEIVVDAYGPDEQAMAGGRVNSCHLTTSSLLDSVAGIIRPMRVECKDQGIMYVVNDVFWQSADVTAKQLLTTLGAEMHETILVH
jgi:hypothetical protein